ncbi:MAG: hypothetical protein K0R15_647 [Clostridiales bacterium]|jgi:hypothetical protein|nr:hypothetical protein [Clostridiales bacterium]
MTNKLKTVLEHAVRLSKEGTMTFDYRNDKVSFAMKIDDIFELRNDNLDGSYSLFYCNEVTASPTQINFKSSDVKNANYYRAGSHPDDECTVDTIEIELIDGSLISLIQDLA